MDKPLLIYECSIEKRELIQKKKNYINIYIDIIKGNFGVKKSK